MSDIPTGDTIQVVLDRMQRASNFASNGARLAETGSNIFDTADTYITAAEMMLVEARRALLAVRDSGMMPAGPSGAR